MSVTVVLGLLHVKIVVVVNGFTFHLRYVFRTHCILLFRMKLCPAVDRSKVQISFCVYIYSHAYVAFLL